VDLPAIEGDIRGVLSLFTACAVDATVARTGEVDVALALHERTHGEGDEGLGCAARAQVTRDASGVRAFAECVRVVLQRTVMHLPERGDARVVVTVSTSPPTPVPVRGALRWEELTDDARSKMRCSADSECVVDVDYPPCTGCSAPRVSAIHLRERVPPPPPPPCTPACSPYDLPCRAGPQARATDFFRARCVAHQCRLEKK
jgi:hypothetical protein